MHWGEGGTHNLMQSWNETGAGKAGAGGTPRAKGAARRRAGLRAGATRGKSCRRPTPDPSPSPSLGACPAVPHPGGGPREGKQCAPTYPAGRRRGPRGPGRSANSPPSSARPAWWGAGPGEGAAPPACQHSPDTPRSAPAAGHAAPGRGFPAPAARPLPGCPAPLLPPSLPPTRGTLPPGPHSGFTASHQPHGPDVEGCRPRVPPPQRDWRMRGCRRRGSAAYLGRPRRCLPAGSRRERRPQPPLRGVLRRLLPPRAGLPQPPRRRSCPGWGASRGALDGSGAERTNLRGSARPTAAKAHFLELIPPCPTPTPCPPLSTPLEISFLPALLPGCRHRPRHASRGRRPFPAPGGTARPPRGAPGQPRLRSAP